MPDVVDGLLEQTGEATIPGRTGLPEMNALRALVVFVVFALSACGVSEDETACVLVEDQRPWRASSRHSRGSGGPGVGGLELKALGERLARNLARSPGLERLAPGLTLDSVQADLDNLRRACDELGSR